MCRKYLMCILLLVSSCDADGAGGSTQPTPVIKYSCDSSKTITTFEITGGTFEHVRLVSKNDFCEPATKDQAGVIQCITGFKTKQNGTSNITILYEDLTHKGFTGGTHIKYFLLSCKEKSNNQIASLTNIDVKPLTQAKPTEVFIVSSKKPLLTIKDPPANIYVGTEIKLQLEIDEAYKMLPATCTAYRQANDPNEYQFWKSCDKTIIDRAIMPDVSWTSVKEDHKTHATINMYAFRFIETSKINLKCDILVCPPSATECDEKCPSDRKRRNANANVTTATASLAFDVFESRHFRENGCQALSSVWYIYATGFGIIYWITVNKF